MSVLDSEVNDFVLNSHIMDVDEGSGEYIIRDEPYQKYFVQVNTKVTPYEFKGDDSVRVGSKSKMVAKLLQELPYEALYAITKQSISVISGKKYV